MNRGDTLLRLARASIATAFEDAQTPIPGDAWLTVPTAVFVTLRIATTGDLRGCVGSIEASRPLGEAVVWAARAAAFRDGRFDPLSAVELDQVRLDVSTLSPLEPLPVQDERDAIAQLARRRPGVVFQDGHRRSVLLPQVWDAVPDPSEFLRHLKLKAGLSPTFWSSAVRLDIFTCEEFEEDDAHMMRVHPS